MKKLIILDGNALIHRSYHALPPTLKTKKGQLVNAVYGFASILFKVIRELEPDYLVATFDLAGPTFRDKEYKEYKAKRVKGPQDLYDQIPLIKELVESFNIPIYEKQGFEADDIIGTIAQQSKTTDNIIVTGDLDALQLVNKNTIVYNLKQGINQIAIYNIKQVKNRYQLKPKQLSDFKGLRGDPSDNIPGVQGVGEKTAIDLIKKFSSLEKLYANLSRSDINPKLKARLLEYKEDAFLSKKLGTIKKDIKIDFNLEKAKWEYDKGKVIKFLEKMEFGSLIKRLNDLQE